MQFFSFLFLPSLSLFGIAVLAALSSSLLNLGKVVTKNLFKEEKFHFFLFYSLFKYFFPKRDWENLFFLMRLTKYLLYGIYTISAYALFGKALFWLPLIIILSLSLLVDFFAQLLASLWPKTTALISSFFSSFYLLFFFPITAIFLKLQILFLARVPLQQRLPSFRLLKDRFRDFLEESGLSQYLDATDQRIFLSLITFREKVAREIMIPRVNLFSLSSDTTIKQATSMSVDEEYSRIPVYKENLDTIIGVLMFKDVLKIYHQNEQEKGKNNLLDMPIESIVKPVLYAPENKKISQLLQELRNKQIHMAIIVNEYGGTEGIVTIEDILEELVGEIADEYDIGEEMMFSKLPDGSWIVDAKMSIVDIESKLDIKIPHSPEYETIGGYVFHRAGTIPSKGWKLHHDEFDLEVLSSKERFIEKIRIVPHHGEEKSISS